MRNIINSIRSTARTISKAALGLSLISLCFADVTDANAASQPPYIYSFSFFTSSGISDHTSTINSTNYTCHAWQIYLGSPSIQCDRIFWQVTRGNDVFESTTSYGPDNPDVGWILYDSGSSGSTRYIVVKTFYDAVDPFYNSYYLTYEDSYYSRCYEEDGFIGIYNP